MAWTVSSEDRRLLRRAGGLAAYFWAITEVLFAAGIVLPSVQAGASTLASNMAFVGVALLASLIFALALGAATVFLPESPVRTRSRLLMGFGALGLGIIGLGVSAAILLAPATGGLIGSDVFGRLIALVALNTAVGALLFLLGYRNLEGSLLPPRRIPPPGRGAWRPPKAS